MVRRCVVCCHVGISAKARSLVQRSPTDFGASLCVVYKVKTEQSVASVGQQSPKKGRIMNENLPPVPCVEPDHTQRKTAILKLHILWTHPVLHHKYLHCSFFLNVADASRGREVIFRGRVSTQPVHCVPAAIGRLHMTNCRH